MSGFLCLFQCCKCLLTPTHLPHQVENEENLSAKIQAGINRRDDEFLAKFFRNKTSSSSGSSELTNQQFSSALEELGLCLQEDEIKVIFCTMDMNNDGVMDLEEFKKAVRFPSPMERVISALPIAQVFADAMPAAIGVDRLWQVGQLTPKRIEDICLAAMPFVKKIIQDAVTTLNASFDVKKKSEDGQSAKKFEVPPEMSAGTVEDFHGGLAGRIGIHIYFSQAHIFQSCALCCGFAQSCLLCARSL
jgi:hypothetical protein